jgi:hypothetical protein
VANDTGGTRHTETADDGPIILEPDMRGPDVEVEDALVVCVLNRGAEVRDDLRGMTNCQAKVASKHFAERFATREGAEVVEPAIDGAGRDDPENTGMAERCRVPQGRLVLGDVFGGGGFTCPLEHHGQEVVRVRCGVDPKPPCSTPPRQFTARGAAVSQNGPQPVGIRFASGQRCRFVL